MHSMRNPGDVVAPTISLPNDALDRLSQLARLNEAKNAWAERLRESSQFPERNCPADTGDSAIYPTSSCQNVRLLALAETANGYPACHPW
eukprot:1682611-Pleurochrysis_carterae.AAC.1